MSDFIPCEVNVYEDNDTVKVTKYTFPPQGETGWHTHAYAYVVTPTISGTLTMIDGDGTRTPYEITKGIPYYRTPGTSHNVVNLTDETVEFVEMEIK